MKLAGHPRHNNVISGQQGNSAAYLTARIKRDHPEIAEQLAAGKFRSVHAAAKAAGIVRELSALDQLRRWWRKASDEEKATFLRQRRAEFVDHPSTHDHHNSTSASTTAK